MSEPVPTAEKTWLQRFLPHPMLTLVLICVWVLLINDFSAGAVVMGTLLGWSISLFTANFWPGRPRIRSYSKAFLYLLLVLWDIIAANIVVARIILFRPLFTLRTRWICLPVALTNPEAVTIFAGTITMTPGTVSCDLSADGRNLLVHCLDVPDVEIAIRDMKQRYEARLMEIFP
jgi:multicomponent K+:H+ antiporter subunit E